MSKIDDGGPAYPTTRVSINGDTAIEGVEGYGPGMSLRDWFAGNAAAAIVGGFVAAQASTGEDDAKLVAKSAYLMADAMIAARKEKNNEQD